MTGEGIVRSKRNLLPEVNSNIQVGPGTYDTLHTLESPYKYRLYFE